MAPCLEPSGDMRKRERKCGDLLNTKAQGEVRGFVSATLQHQQNYTGGKIRQVGTWFIYETRTIQGTQASNALKAWQKHHHGDARETGPKGGSPPKKTPIYITTHHRGGDWWKMDGMKKEFGEKKDKDLPVTHHNRASGRKKISE